MKKLLSEEARECVEVTLSEGKVKITKSILFEDSKDEFVDKTGSNVIMGHVAAALDAIHTVCTKKQIPKEALEEILEIGGHINGGKKNKKNDDWAINLSKQRAARCAGCLLAPNINWMISQKGYGGSVPLKSGDDNRRVEIKLTNTTKLVKAIQKAAETAAQESLKKAEELKKRMAQAGGANLLHEAVLLGSWRAAERLCRERSELLVNQDIAGNNPLHVAACRFQGIEALLAMYAAVRSRDAESNYTAMQAALGMRNNQHMTPLECAKGFKQIELVDALTHIETFVASRAKEKLPTAAVGDNHCIDVTLAQPGVAVPPSNPVFCPDGSTDAEALEEAARSLLEEHYWRVLLRDQAIADAAAVPVKAKQMLQAKREQAAVLLNGYHSSVHIETNPGLPHRTRWKSYFVQAIHSKANAADGEYLQDTFLFNGKPTWKHMREDFWIRRNAADTQWVICKTPLELLSGAAAQSEVLFHTSADNADTARPPTGPDHGWVAGMDGGDATAITMTSHWMKTMFKVNNCSRAPDANGDYVLEAGAGANTPKTWRHVNPAKDLYIRRNAADTCWLIAGKTPGDAKLAWHIFTLDYGLDKSEPSETGWRLGVKSREAKAVDYDPTLHESERTDHSHESSENMVEIEVARYSEEMDAPLATSAMWPTWLVEQQGEYVALCAGVLQYLRDAYYTMAMDREHLIYVMMFIDVSSKGYLPKARLGPFATEVYRVLQDWVQKLGHRTITASNISCGVKVKFTFPKDKGLNVTHFEQSEIMRDHFAAISFENSPADRPFRLLLHKTFRDGKDALEKNLKAEIEKLKAENAKQVAAVMADDTFRLGETETDVRKGNTRLIAHEQLRAIPKTAAAGRGHPTMIGSGFLLQGGMLLDSACFLCSQAC